MNRLQGRARLQADVRKRKGTQVCLSFLLSPYLCFSVYVKMDTFSASLNTIVKVREN